MIDFCGVRLASNIPVNSIYSVNTFPPFARVWGSENGFNSLTFAGTLSDTWPLQWVLTYCKSYLWFFSFFPRPSLCPISKAIRTAEHCLTKLYYRKVRWEPAPLRWESIELKREQDYKTLKELQSPFFLSSQLKCFNGSPLYCVPPDCSNNALFRLFCRMFSGITCHFVA